MFNFLGKILKNFLKFLFLPKELRTSKEIKINKWKAYAEELVIQSGICLENVLIHPYGQWGLAGRRLFTNYTYKHYEGNDYKILIPKQGLPFIVVPEIKGWWEFYAWLHEIGHYVHKHYEQDDKKTYYKEYEAEKYALEKAKESGVVNEWDFIDMKFSAVSYLSSHIDTAIVDGDIKNIEDIPDEVLQFFYQVKCMKEILNDKFVVLENESIKKHRNWDRYYR